MSATYELILDQVEQALVLAGFGRDAVLRDYDYADYLGDSQTVRRVALAAFGETPPSYRSACVALARLEGDQPRDNDLEPLLGLGARRVITVGPRQASVWSFERSRPEKLADHPRGELGRVIRTRSAEWAPAALLRAGQIKPLGPYQLDFGDLGLVPLIEHQVNTKLDRLLSEVLAGCIERQHALRSGRRFHRLVRAVFWLLAAKVLVDRRHGSLVASLPTAKQALDAAHRHYGGHALGNAQGYPLSDLLDPQVTDWAWQAIHSSFHFENLSVDALAFVYENTLVSPEVRSKLGIHGTPRAIAELVLSLLPIEALPQGGDVILEPCAGFGPFLLAALRRLRSTALVGLPPEKRHTELVRRLRGIELDAFAVEVGRLCLTLADYPSPDGWQLWNEDVFAPGVLERAQTNVGAVIANPPFEAFTAEDKIRHSARRSEKAAELLRRVIETSSPAVIGIVVPRVVPDSGRAGYRELRAKLRHDYREVDRVDLPDNLFGYSNVESALLIGRFRRDGIKTTLRHARVPSARVAEALSGAWAPVWMTDEQPATGENAGAPLRIDDLRDVWTALADLPKLGTIAKIHRGVEYRRSLKIARNELISASRRPGLVPGLSSADDLLPYQVVRKVFLNTDPDEIRRAGNLAWKSPKVVVNAARRRRGPWCLAAAPDTEGMWFYQRLHGVWPNDVTRWPIEVIAAVLNGPAAAAFIGSKRDIHRSALAEIPLPDPAKLHVQHIVALVRGMAGGLDVESAMRIDAEILRGYDLPPRLERRLLLRFEREDRPGLPAFRGYYPADFESALPLHRVLTDLTDEHRASWLLDSTPRFNNPAVSEMFEEIAAGYGK